MNRTLVFGIAIFFAVIGLSLVGGEKSASAGLFHRHGCGGCHGGAPSCDGGYGGEVVDCGGCGGHRCHGLFRKHRCHGHKRCHGLFRKHRCHGCHGPAPSCCGEVPSCCGEAPVAPSCHGAPVEEAPATPDAPEAPEAPAAPEAPQAAPSA